MIKIGSEVVWMWVGRPTTGVVLEMHPVRHEIISKGKYIVRNGTPEDPALVIEYSKGSIVLKLLHEVRELSLSQ
jgi:hypothetical protein